MASDEDLQINTRHALTKHSPSAILEEHGSCEVPAGCGGVVLRWRDPDVGRPAVVRLGHLGALTAWLDGEEVVNSWVELRAGRHVFAVELRDIEEPVPFIAVIVARGTVGAPPVLMASAPGHAWRVHRQPPEGWIHPEFDDRSWDLSTSGADLVPSSDDDTDRVHWRFRSLQAMSAEPLRVAGPTLAIRGTFHVA